jgi:ABC-2 type transport system ATP-binding protein
MEQCGLCCVCDKKIGRLSHGYRQRTGIAQALVSDPGVLIIDEPTSGLDPAQIQETRSLLKQLGKSKTILISTHILSEVEQICDSVIILYKGKIAYQCSLQELIQEDELILTTEAPFTTIFQEKAFSLLTGIKNIRAITSDTLSITVQKGHDVRREIWQLSCQYQWPILKMDYARNSLENVYLRVTSEEF